MKTIFASAVALLLLTSATYAAEYCDPSKMQCTCAKVPVKNEDGKVLYWNYDISMCNITNASDGTQVAKSKPIDDDNGGDTGEDPGEDDNGGDTREDPNEDDDDNGGDTNEDHDDNGGSSDTSDDHNGGDSDDDSDDHNGGDSD